MTAESDVKEGGLCLYGDSAHHWVHSSGPGYEGFVVQCSLCRDFNWAAMASEGPGVHDETIRTDAAEREVRRARRVLARLLEMADAWETTFGDGRIRADVAAGQIRDNVRRDGS